MKYAFYVAVVAMAMVGCSSDDQEDKGGIQEQQMLISAIKYDNSENLDSEYLTYDEKGRIASYERNDTVELNTVVINPNGSLWDKRRTDKCAAKYEYTYDDENGRIYISYVGKFASNGDNPLRYAYGYDTLYVQNGLITKTTNDEYIGNDKHYYWGRREYYFEYNSDNTLKRVSYKSPDADGSRFDYIYDVEWENGNIKLYHEGIKSENKFEYSELKGFIPTYNNYSFMMPTRYAMLAAQGLFGITPVNLMASYSRTKASHWYAGTILSEYLQAKYKDEGNNIGTSDRPDASRDGNGGDVIEYVTNGNRVLSAVVSTKTICKDGSFIYRPFRNMTFEYK